MQAFFTSTPYISRMAQKTNPPRGQLLKEFREASGLSQSQLAEQLKVHRSNIGFWENSGIIPRSDLLIPMSKLLGVPVEKLLGENPKASKLPAPAGRARIVFDRVSKLPKRQQQKILEVVEALVNQQTQIA